MKRLLILGLTLLAPGVAMAATVGGSGTQPYACTVVGDSSIALVSTGQNQLTATGSGTIYQNGDTNYTIANVTTTGPDANIASTITAIGGTLNLSATRSTGSSQVISGELSENVTYTVTVSSTDSILSAGSYTSQTSLTCAAN